MRHSHLALALAAALVLARPLHADPSELRFSRVALSTGVELHVAEQGPINGEPLILLHGYSDSWFSYSRILPLLPDDYRVFALDLRGHGRSSRPAKGYGMDDLARDVVAFMDAKGIVRGTIVGHSMGGFVAQQVALAAPKRVARLVIVSSARTPRAFNGIDEFKEVVESLRDPISREFVEEFQRSTVHRPVPEEFMEGVIGESQRLSVNVWQGLMKGMLEVKPAVSLGRSGIPALVMWGEQDAWPPRAEQDSLVAMLRTARLAVLKNTGHAPHWEAPDEFVRELLGFLRSTEPAGE
jgi:pimeloyl-ACP methyl ester carboxylesterase